MWWIEASPKNPDAHEREDGGAARYFGPGRGSAPGRIASVSFLTAVLSPAVWRQRRRVRGAPGAITVSDTLEQAAREPTPMERRTV